jgi:acetoin utilization protein AcuC
MCFGSGYNILEYFFIPVFGHVRDADVLPVNYLILAPPEYILCPLVEFKDIPVDIKRYYRVFCCALVRTFAPDLILAELGADTLISDPLTHLKLTNNGYIRAVKRIIEICPRILALGGDGYDLYRTARCWPLAWSALNNLEPVDEFAGLVGEMMFGPEMEVGSLFDHSHTGTGEEKAMTEVKRVVEYLRKEVFPVHGL